jgi:Uma2 family endonuclease
MHSRVEQLWDFPGVDDDDRPRSAATVQPLWPGIPNGRPKPLFDYPIEASEYLELEEASTEKHEYVDGYVYAMAGASDGHGTIAFNLAGAVHPLLRGKRCKGFLSDMKVEIPDAFTSRGRPKYYYPDFLITCSEADLSPSASKIKKEPCLVVEVLSGSTQLTDRTEKLDEYRRIQALQQYWLVDQDRRRVIVYARDDAGWRMTEHLSLESVLPLPVGDGTLVLRLGDLYDKVFEL